MIFEEHFKGNEDWRDVSYRYEAELYQKLYTKAKPMRTDTISPA